MTSRRRRNGPPNCGDDSDGSGLYLQSSSLVAQKVVVRREYFVAAKGQRHVGRIIEGETSRPRNVRDSLRVKILETQYCHQFAQSGEDAQRGRKRFDGEEFSPQLFEERIPDLIEG